MNIKNVPIHEIKPYENNPRSHPVKQLEALVNSINKFGFRGTILLDRNNTIVAGHARYEAAATAGLNEIPCEYADDLTDEEIAAYRILDNKIAAMSYDDDEKLQAELAKMPDFPWDEFNVEFPTIEQVKEGECDEDETPELKIEATTKLGDVWLLGNHRLMCGDSTMVDNVDKLMNGEKAKLCFTSPPYSDARDYQGNLNLEPSHIAQFISSSFNNCELYAVNLGIIRKDNAILQYWDDYINEAKNCGLNVLSWNIWDKGEAGSVGNQTAMFAISHEFIFVFGKEPIKLNRTVENKYAGHLATHSGNRQKDGTVMKQKDRIVSSHSQLKTVLNLTAQKARDDIDHPARFPVALPEEYILACTNDNDLIYEPFGGSGTTLIAAEKHNRKCYMMEIAPNYCDVIIKRWQKFTGNEAVLESSGFKFNELSPLV